MRKISKCLIGMKARPKRPWGCTYTGQTDKPRIRASGKKCSRAAVPYRGWVSWKTVFAQTRGGEGGWFQDNSSMFLLLCTLFLLLLHQLHLSSSDIRSWRLRTPGIKDERKGEDQDAAVIKVLWTHSAGKSARQLDQPRLGSSERFEIWKSGGL